MNKTTALEIFKENKYCVGAYINNKISSLNTEVSDDDTVAPILLNMTDGQRIYKKSVLFVLCAAFNNLYPEYTLETSHSIYRGEFINISPNHISQEQINHVLALIHRWVQEDIVIEKLVANEKNNQITIIKQYENLPLTNGHFYIYKLNDYTDYSIDVLVPSCGFLSLFNIQIEDDGLLIMIPKKSNPSVVEVPKKHKSLANTFKTMEQWSRIHGIHYLGDLNQKVINGDYVDTIRICEALMENSFAEVSKEAIERNSKIIFLTGPSSSGKTTSAYRLRIQLMVQGMSPFVISMDNYFKNRAELKHEADGSVDLESVECVDVESFAFQVKSLIDGVPVNLRRFEFVKGEAFYDDEPTQLPPNNILIIEGIHAFNPYILKMFDGINYYKLAINPLTLINIDHHNRLSSSDVRKMRRIVRDNRTRGFSADDTLSMWPNIRSGEEKNIFPFLENCDKMINTTLVYEVAALKKHALKALDVVDRNASCMPEVNRLINILAKVKSLPSEKDIPQNSILREFIGE